MLAIKPVGGVGVVACLELAGQHMCIVNDDEVGAARMLLASQHAPNRPGLHGQAGFFQTFTLGGPCWVLTRVYETGRKRPQSSKRFIGTPDQKNTSTLLKEYRDRHLWIGEV